MYGIRRHENLDRTKVDKTTEAKKETNAPLLGNTVSKEKVEEARQFWGRFVWGETTESKKESDAE